MTGLELKNQPVQENFQLKTGTEMAKTENITPKQKSSVFSWQGILSILSPDGEKPK